MNRKGNSNFTLFCVLGLAIVVVVVILASNHDLKSHFNEVCQDNNLTRVTDWIFLDGSFRIMVECDEEEIFRVHKKEEWIVNKWGEIKYTGEYKYISYNELGVNEELW